MSSNVVEGTKVEIGAVFRGNIFLSAEGNIRGFVWGVDKAEMVFHTINSIDLLKNDERSLNSVDISEIELDTTKKNAMGISPTSTMYEVHDGQQRLVTLTLALAAAAASIEAHYKKNGIQVDTETLVFVKKIAEAIAPLRYLRDGGRRGRVPRIVMRENKALKSILTHPFFGAANQSTLEPATKKPRHELSIEDRQEIKEEDSKRIWNVYYFFLRRCDEKGLEWTQQFVEKILERTKVVKTLYQSKEEAQQRVMDQYYGMAINPVYYFRYFISHGSSMDPKEKQEKTATEFKRLSRQAEFGEKVVGDACRIAAKVYGARQGALLMFVPRNEVSEFHQIVKARAADGVPGWQFFEDDLKPIADILDSFRHKPLEPGPLFDILSLFRSMSQVSRTRLKEMESVIIATFHLLEKDDQQLIVLDALVTITAWMILTRQSAQSRAERCCSIMGQLGTTTTGELSPDLIAVLQLTGKEKYGLRTFLNTEPFGWTSDKPDTTEQIKHHLFAHLQKMCPAGTSLLDMAFQKWGLTRLAQAAATAAL